MKKLLCALALMSISVLASAQETVQPYFVSGVLQKDGELGTIKLVQLVVVTDNSESAKLILAAKTGRDFPGYHLVDAMASDLAQLYKPVGAPVEPVKQKLAVPI